MIIIDIKNVKAILFDSGRTLNIPRTGHWFITPKFYEIIDASKLKDKQELLDDGIRKACDYADKIKLIKNEEEEFRMFREFYRIVLEETKYPDIDDRILNNLAEDNVYNDDKFLFFDDVESSIKKLNQNYILGIVSDTWPSLERVFINRGLREYFSTFIISSIYGSYKSEKVLFKIALEELNTQPYETIFIDDNETNLVAAEEFGMVPILIDRYERNDLKSKYPIIKSLEDLSNFLLTNNIDS
ncbi:HAD family hydrolase [Tissierella sp. MSJ-40]|uniref:HAD family hydrolase n=1 Tax=Tissierella simiarum TaxID=2841534 RepID=A0ABS6E9L9_9FIRM|nr:HAD family hydrolase [Tissierella simiarum]